MEWERGGKKRKEMVDFKSKGGFKEEEEENEGRAEVSIARKESGRGEKRRVRGEGRIRGEEEKEGLK